MTLVLTRPVFYFYKNGNCKRGIECRFQHPTICKIYRKFGIKKRNEKGCGERCNQFHPNVCRDSLKSHSCPRKDCRFYHIKGTKNMDFINSIYKKKSSNPNFESKNKFSILNIERSKHSSSQNSYCSKKI